MENYKIFEEIDTLRNIYETEELEKIVGLKRSQYQVIKMCEYYSASRYLGYYLGNKDKRGKSVPFYNIVNYRVSLAKTATDLDIKDIQIVSDNPKHQVQSMLLNRETYEWMKESEFAIALNKMGSKRPKYGGYLIKKCYNKEGELKIDVVDWTKVITNQSNILGGAIIERHSMTPVEIKNKERVWENTVEVLKANKKIKNKDKSSNIDIYEVLGEFPECVYKNAIGETETEKDEYIYSLQKYFIAELDGKKFIMYADKLTGVMTDYYEYLSWEDQSADLGRGVIEDTEEAQVWTNDSVINEKNVMELAGKVFVKTNSKKIAENVDEVDNGKIFALEDGKDMTPFSMMPSAIGQFQNQLDKWKAQANDATNSYNATTGEQPPSGTPYSQTVLLNQVATKPFDYKREEWGVHLTKVFGNWVIPYLIKKISKEHILVSEFSDTELDLIDESFANKNTNGVIKEELLRGNVVSQIQAEDVKSSYLQHIKKLGKKRYIEVPKDYFRDIDSKVTVITTGEQKNKAVVLQSLSTILQTVIQSYNPNTGKFGVLEDPKLAKIFSEIIELTGSGISPISLGLGKVQSTQTTQATQAPQPMPTPMETPALATSISNG